MNVGGAAAVMSGFAAIWWVVGTAATGQGSLPLYAVGLEARLDRAVVAIIVGLHFAPLAHWLPAPIYYVTGALLVVVGLVGTAIQEPTARILTVCFGAAVALWLSCALVLRQHATRAIRRAAVRDA